MEGDKDKEKDFDVIFAFAFGSPHDLISNHNIADRVKEIYKSHSGKIVLMSQKDIIFSDLFKDFFRLFKESSVCKNRIVNIRILDLDMKGYPSTLKLIKDFSGIAKHYNWKKVLVIAAPMHSKRCVRDLRKMGLDAYEDKYLWEKYSMASIWWYHHNSTQFWTRSGLYWWPREIILRLLPWKIYEWISDRF